MGQEQKIDRRQKTEQLLRCDGDESYLQHGKNTSQQHFRLATLCIEGGYIRSRITGVNSV